MLANVGEDWVEGGNPGDLIFNQNLKEKVGSMKDNTTSALESGKQTFVTIF